MAQYHLRVAAGQLHIRFHTGEETNIPLDDATASDTLWNVVTNLESDGEAAASFPEGLLELWLHRTTMAMTSQQMQSMSTEYCTVHEGMPRLCVHMFPSTVHKKHSKDAAWDHSLR